MTPRITRLHSANNDFQHAEVLRRNRHKRQRFGEFFVEGVRSINLALAHGWPLTALYFSNERPLSDWARNIIDVAGDARRFDLPLPLLAELSEKEETSEIVALVRMPPDDLERIPRRPDPLILLIDRPASPGNLGSLIRSADALGADGMIVTGHAADAYDPETIRASTGSLFALPVVRQPSPRTVLPWFAARGLDRIVGTDEDGAVDLWDCDFTGPTVLFLGNETWGLSAGARELCTSTVRIPIGGAASSLNVASAGSIVLYEVARQRKRSHRG